MRSKKRTARSTAAALWGAAALVIAGAVAVIGLTGWPPARAVAGPAPERGVARLGVLHETAVVLGPEVAAHDKFDTITVGAQPAGGSGLLKAAVKRSAQAPRVAVVRRPVRITQTRRVAPVAKARPRQSAGGWRVATVSWYGPGFYGNGMAGGGKLTPTSMVVAHRTLPFGTRVQVRYQGRTVTATVMDRGPHVAGREFDLGPGTAKALGFSGVGRIRYRILGR